MGRTNPIVIADAGPILHLDELGCLDLLADFDKVLVPKAVWLEVERHRPLALKAAKDWLVRQPSGQYSAIVSALTPLYSLHAGEPPVHPETSLPYGAERLAPHEFGPERGNSGWRRVTACAG